MGTQQLNRASLVSVLNGDSWNQIWISGDPNLAPSAWVAVPEKRLPLDFWTRVDVSGGLGGLVMERLGPLAESLSLAAMLPGFSASAKLLVPPRKKCLRGRERIVARLGEAQVAFVHQEPRATRSGKPES